MGGVAASGGYYIALGADTIVANPGTATGSIGVIMSYPIVGELMNKVGIQYESIKSAKLKLDYFLIAVNTSLHSTDLYRIAGA